MNHSRLDTTKAYRLACRLRKCQILLDDDEFERMRQACLGLQIHEGGPSSAFNLPGGGAGYVLSVDIWNPSQRRLSPEHIVFEGFEGEFRMRVFPDPRKEYPMGLNHADRRRCEREIGLDYLLARQLYVFPELHWHRYSREEVLNHLIGPRRFLYPGDPPLEGFLLTVGQEPIPWNYSDGDHFKVRLTIFIKEAPTPRGSTPRWRDRVKKSGSWRRSPRRLPREFR